MRHHSPIRLPSGHWFNPERLRSEGVLDAEELDWCRHEGVPVGYDPAQIGWVSMLGEDDISATTTAHPWSVQSPQLRPWRRDEVDVLRALLDDPQLWRYLPEPFPAPLTRELAADLIEVALIEGHHEVRAVEHEGQVVGQVRLQFDTHAAERRVAEISYWFGRAHWGRGLGSTVVSAATISAFERHRKLERITARVHPDNRASAVILARIGYQPVQRDDGWLGFMRNR